MFEKNLTLCLAMKDINPDKLIKKTSMFFIIVFSALFFSIPIKFFSGVFLFPDLFTMIIFYFCVNKHKQNYFLIFACGAVFDIFNNLPFTFTSLVLLLSSKIINQIFKIQFVTSKNFMKLTIIDFIIFEAINLLIKVLLTAFIEINKYNLNTLLYQFLLDISFFSATLIIIDKFKKSNHIL
jgi:hypothetical protein